ncbi:MATE family multidrug resistance protein [Polychaeton citri CBS 116435]|uniref:MATE family multidrug resistance protein n=1 Tax=Polychaeton citri CBS 116435 TaxID=1314669 RepID=A0A9P4QJI1_9PEZI|nr:MATE family multidrug resistance protein [Polychaeton citri CBS 116435]
MATPPKPNGDFNAVSALRNTADGSFGGRLSRSLGHSWQEASPIAQASLARDIEEAESESDEALESDDGTDDADQDTSLVPTQSFNLASSYHRPSFSVAGNRATLRPFASQQDLRLSREERRRVLGEERSLLRDNNLIPPKHPTKPSDDGSTNGRRRSVLGRLVHIPGGEGSALRDSAQGEPSETTSLLPDPSQRYGGQGDAATVTQKWEEAIKEGKIQTTWQREGKVLLSYGLPLMATFVLQYSLTVASIFTLGHIGEVELGAVSLASMTANITGYAIYQGLATSLDTLCAQAYGSGRKKLVGLQMQRMICFLWTITIPIAIVWLLADKILMVIVPEPAVAELAGLYLKVVLAGAPGFAAFEAAKRFAQAQGLFSASLCVLIVLAPLNAFMNWFFVWKLELGFVGAPIAVAITDNLLPVGIFIYIRFFSKNGMQCWNGFTRKAWHNWGPMIKLALPGLVMVEAEVLAFEILTFASSYFGTTALAAQSVVATLTNISYQIPFPLSIAASTRIANLIGATLADAAKMSTKVAFIASLFVGVLNFCILAGLRNHIPWLFTSSPEVVRLVAEVLPLCAAFQLVDSVASLCNGALRGLGRQHFGGYVQLFSYYVIAMPISMGLAFGADWGLLGLWTGVAIALALVALIELVYLYKTDWNRSVEEARERNANEG